MPPNRYRSRFLLAVAMLACLRAGGDVVVALELAPLHAAAVVGDREAPGGRIRRDRDPGGARIEGVGDDLGEDRFLERAGVGIAQIFEQVQQVDARLAHARRTAGWMPTVRPQARGARRQPRDWFVTKGYRIEEEGRPAPSATHAGSCLDRP